MIRYRRFLGREDREAAAYTSSLGRDEWLAPYIVRVMAAHVVALADNNVVPREKLSCTASVLLKLLSSEPYSVVVEAAPDAEDFFEALEAYLYKLCGEDAGYIPIGRSRNDQVSASLILAVRSLVVEVLRELIGLRRSLITKAREHRGIVIPVFTHLQVAQAAWASDYLLSYEEAFSDAWRSLSSALRMLNKNPLGSGPAAGTMVGFRRRSWRGLLCFERDFTEPYYATSSRLLILLAVAQTAVLMVELSRLAEDLVVFSSQGYGVFELPDELVATSSIMPHKRNPVAAEVLRARAGGTIGDLAAALSMYKGLPYGYNLDLQEINDRLRAVLETTLTSVRVASRMIKGLRISRERAARLLQGSVYWGQELSESLALRTGKPFREAYFSVAAALKEDSWRPGTNTSRLLDEAGINPDKPDALVRARSGEPDMRITAAEERLAADEEELARIEEMLRGCEEELVERLREISGRGEAA